MRIGSVTDERTNEISTYAANKPMKSIQLAIENVPPSSVLRFVTTLWSSFNTDKVAG